MLVISWSDHPNRQPLFFFCKATVFFLHLRRSSSWTILDSQIVIDLVFPVGSLVWLRRCFSFFPMSCDRLDSIRVDQIVTSGKGIEIASPNQTTDYIRLTVRYQS